MSTLDGSVRQTIPATAMSLVTERHEAIVSGLRANTTPLADQPPVRPLALKVVGNLSLDFYKSFQPRT